MFVLALECSTAHGSLALTGGWRTEFTTGRGEGGKLFTALAAAMQVVRAADGRLDRIVVGLGPGSYSGVRQAIAAATGLASATGAQLVGVPSPAALEVGASRYQAVGDARRGTFYYTAVENGVCVAGPELLEDRTGLQARLAERADWPVFAVDSLPEGMTLDTQIALPSAERLLFVPIIVYISASLEPIYLRPVAFTLPKVKKLQAGSNA